LVMIMDSYTEKTIERFKDPKNAGEMKDADAAGEEGNLHCGDMMRIYIKVREGKIADAKFQTYGCIAAISATDALCDMIKGKTLDEAEKITGSEVIDSLGGLPKIKYHCSVMGRGALKRAITDYRAGKKPEFPAAKA